MKKITCLLVAIILAITLLAGCSTKSENYVESSSSETSVEETDYFALIEEATTVKIREEFISLNKKYNVYVDGNHVATVSGEYVNITGDVFTLTDGNGNTIAKEKQIKRWGVKLNRLAHVMDQDGNTTGYIGEEFFTDLFSLSKYNFHIYDSEKNELGYTKEQLISLLDKFNVYDTDDEVLFTIEKQIDIVDAYTIVKQNPDAEISMKDVIFLTCIVDAIEDASEEESEKSSGS